MAGLNGIHHPRATGAQYPQYEGAAVLGWLACAEPVPPLPRANSRVRAALGWHQETIDDAGIVPTVIPRGMHNVLEYVLGSIHPHVWPYALASIRACTHNNIELHPAARAHHTRDGLYASWSGVSSMQSEIASTQSSEHFAVSKSGSV